jgi:CHASE3 domain sensor protein
MKVKKIAKRLRARADELLREVNAATPTVDDRIDRYHALLAAEVLREVANQISPRSARALKKAKKAQKKAKKAAKKTKKALRRVPNNGALYASNKTAVHESTDTRGKSAVE